MRTRVVVFSSLFLAALISCTRMTPEQMAQTLKDNPKLLADAIKKDPQVFKDALMAAQQELRKSQAKAQQEETQKEQEKHFRDPLKPKLGADQTYKGSPSAKVTIVEYTDFECPYCGQGAKIMAEVLKKYDGKVRVTIKHLPLPFHPNAMPAARYFEAIRQVNPKAAIRFHDALFDDQGGLRQGGEKFLEDEAKKAGVTPAKLKKALQSEKIKKKIDADMEEARSFGFRGTPSFVVGGVPVRGAYPIDEFSRIIDRLLAQKN